MLRIKTSKSILFKLLEFYGNKLHHRGQWRIHGRLQSFFSTDGINEEMTVKRNGMMWHLNPSDFVHADVLWYGYKDPQDIYIIMKLLNENSTIFDVGANFGYYSMLLAKKLGCRAFAFEPMPQNIVRFKNNLDANNLNDKVTLFEIGLSSGPDRAFIEDRPGNSGASFVSMTPTETEIKLDCLDNIYKKLGRPQIDFMKIDIEGHELSFLEGAQIALIEAKPFLLVEIDPPKLRRSGMTQNLLQTNFEFMNYSGRSIWECTQGRRL